ncbi:MAG: hypothetical protein K2X12_02635 [Burkholderiaceae bacterium]|jgi:hypothetical protein|nr:hypothetical protein [Burkholderiaceae bacterium]
MDIARAVVDVERVSAELLLHLSPSTIRMSQNGVCMPIFNAVVAELTRGQFDGRTVTTRWIRAKRVVGSDETLGRIFLETWPSSLVKYSLCMNDGSERDRKLHETWPWIKTSALEASEVDVMFTLRLK